MSRFSGVYILIFWCAAASGGLAQTTAPTTAPPSGIEENRRRGSSRLEQFGGGRGDSSAQPVFAKRGALAFKQRLSRDQKKMLAPDAADLNRHAALLRKPNTGLIKLFPDLDCENDARVVRADETCLNQIPTSAFYSFREREHTTDFLADIRLKNDVLVSDGLLMQSILVGLGEMPLENVVPSSEGMKFLTEFKPGETSEQALEQTFRLIKGIEADGYLYRKTLPARENSTYALRVIAYRGKIVQTVRGFPFNMLEGDNRIDVTIAFRLLKKDQATGVYTLLWKELARRDAPKIIFPKRNKRQNIKRTR